MTDEGMLERFTEQIDRREKMILQQRDSITRLLTAVRVKDVPEAGTVVVFELDPAGYAVHGYDSHSGPLVVKESSVDSEGVVHVILHVG